MSGAILQGVPATTLDTDIWIDLPSRQHIRVLNLCRRLGADIRANTVVDLRDGSEGGLWPESTASRAPRYGRSMFRTSPHNTILSISQ
jgi:hypothetical protein